MFDYSKLRGRIREIMGTEGKFAKAMGVSGNTISQKLNGNIPWKNGEILTACEVLDIDIEFIPVYFFTEKVQNGLTDKVKSEEGKTTMNRCTYCGDSFTGEEISEMRAEHEEFSMHPFICPDCWDCLQRKDPEEMVKSLLKGV